MNIEDLLNKANRDPGDYALCRMVGSSKKILGVVDKNEISNQKEKLVCYVLKEDLNVFEANDVFDIYFDDEHDVPSMKMQIIESCSCVPFFGWDYHYHIAPKR